MVHAEILALDAFPPVSGIVARAAERLTLIELGLDPKSLVIIEVGHRELRPEYESTLAAYQEGSRDGLSLWIGHCADAVVVVRARRPRSARRWLGRDGTVVRVWAPPCARGKPGLDGGAATRDAA